MKIKFRDEGEYMIEKKINYPTWVDVYMLDKKKIPIIEIECFDEIKEK